MQLMLKLQDQFLNHLMKKVNNHHLEMLLLIPMKILNLILKVLMNMVLVYGLDGLWHILDVLLINQIGIKLLEWQLQLYTKMLLN